MTLPLQTTRGRQDRQAIFHILKRFEFESSHMRSGVVAVEHHKGKHVTDGSLIIRGAAAVIERMIDKDVLPPKYRQVGLLSILITSQEHTKHSLIMHHHALESVAVLHMFSPALFVQRLHLIASASLCLHTL